MREIKFRAWIPAGNKYEYIDDFYWFEENFFHNQKAWESQGIVIEQYAGLKDKTGKEIYEGDILSWPDKAAIWVVKWKDMRTFTDWHSSHQEPEIIGNIHENPELLK